MSDHYFIPIDSYSEELMLEDTEKHDEISLSTLNFSAQQRLQQPSRRGRTRGVSDAEPAMLSMAPPPPPLPKLGMFEQKPLPASVAFGRKSPHSDGGPPPFSFGGRLSLKKKNKNVPPPPAPPPVFGAAVPMGSASILSRSYELSISQVSC